MKIRKYSTSDCKEMAKLFFETVHTINARDYTEPQLDAWADGKIDLLAWDKSFLSNNTLVAETDDIIVGFGDMDDSGYLDRLYIHKDYQGRGIAKAILAQLERQAIEQGICTFVTHASITAKAFFEGQGYIVVRDNSVIRKGVKLTNFIMKKQQL